MRKWPLAGVKHSKDFGISKGDNVMIPLPLNHSLGMRVFRTALYFGASVVIQNGFAFAKELENNIDTFGCTAMVSVPVSMDLTMRGFSGRDNEKLECKR